MTMMTNEPRRKLTKQYINSEMNMKMKKNKKNKTEGPPQNVFSMIFDLRKEYNMHTYKE